jgi:hypothetical protein
MIMLALTVAADECQRLPLPSVTVKRLDEKISNSLEYGYKTLNSLSGALSRPGNQVLGLTRGQTHVRYEMKLHRLLSADGQWECASPQITLSYGFTPMTIYVAREFPLGSCAYREVFAHEQRHVRAYQAHAQAVEAEIVEAMNHRFATGSYWRGPVGEAQIRLKEELGGRWIPYVKNVLKRVESDQARIDTPDEYDRISASCDGEIRRLLFNR